MADSLPVIGIPADFRGRGSGRHSTDDLYVRAIVEQVGALPVIIPALEDKLDLGALLDRLDGIVLTGNESNVAAARYGAEEVTPGSPQDLRRDASNFPLIPRAVANAIPLFAICRGFQELNVAYGGSLHQKLHELPERIDHRAPEGEIPAQYALAHDVTFAEDGLLRGFANAPSGKVNSLHWQGVDRLGQGLAVEAIADDGTIEAIRVAHAPAFALAVQWHPEYEPADDPLSQAIWFAFRDAVLHRRQSRSGKVGPAK